MYKFKIYFAAAAALLLAACSDESSNEVVPATGTDVTFSTSLGVNSRTYYGERVGDAFPIYWNTSEKGFDQIMIFSDECTPKVAEYVVQIEGTGETNYSTNVVKTGEVGLRWGESSEATFYAIYPSSAVDETTFNGYSVNAEIPAAQYAQAITQDGTSFVCEPNMNYALMYAVAPKVPNDGKNGVDLNFTPLPTVLDITVNGPTGNLANNSIRVTSVQVRSTDPDTPIAGDFQVNLADGTCTSVGNDFTNITAFFNNDGGAITLTQGQSINLKVFLRPGIENADNLEVQVNTASGGYLKKLTDAGTLVNGQIHPLSMPKIETKGAVLNPANWMAMLDPNIYITELSIPGAWSANMVNSRYNSYNQAVDYPEQYNSGIRAFLFETQYRSNNLVLRENTRTTLATVLSTLSTMMEKHPEEFVVVMLTDWTDKPHNPNWISAIKDLIKGNPAVYQDEITPETTIADVKGKIIIKINDNPGSNDYTSEYTYTDGIPAILSMYNSKEGASDAASTPLIWGKNSGYNNDNSTMWWCYTEAGSIGGSGNPDLNDREKAISALFEMAVSHKKNQWFMFGLGGKWTAWGADNAQTIAEELNPFMKNAIDVAISSNSPVPLGLVMMNSADRTSNKAQRASSISLIDAIINNNNAFDLEKRPSTNNN